MKTELLYKIADIINSKSSEYRAIVPMKKHDYMMHKRGRLVRSSCLVLRIMISRKIKSPGSRAIWNIYEKDLDKIIQKICRRDAAFAKRVASCEVTAQDIELLIRRASFKYLRLNISSPLLYMYIKK